MTLQGRSAAFALRVSRKISDRFAALMSIRHGIRTKTELAYRLHHEWQVDDA